jgi:predicted Zn finger-like uncharacterized protein
MNIECTSCHARYTIADSLVPPQGARVRCRKCGEVMQVKSAAPVVMPSELPLVPPSPESPPFPAEQQAPPAAVTPPSRPSAPQPPPDSGEGFERFPSQETASERPAEPEFERFASSNTPTVETAPAAPPRAAPAPPVFGASPFPEEPAPAEPPPFPTQQAAAPSAPFPAQQAPAPFPTQQARAQHPPFPAQQAPAAPRAAHAPPASAPEAAAPARPRISASAVPDGLTPEEMQRHEKARRLARVLASDIAIYNREKRERGIKDGNLVAVLGYEIKKSWETYKERVGADFANTTPYFRDALNEIVAEGKKIF